MLNSFTKGLSKIFGSKSDKDIKAIMPIVKKINEEFSKLSSISDDALRAETVRLKGVISDYLKELDDKVIELKAKAESDVSIHDKEELFETIDKLEVERNVKLEEVLMNILPEAFAVMKETGRRLTQNEQLVVTATDFDEMLAGKKGNVVIEGNQAVWANKWLAAGNEITWNMIHYDVQLIGGVVLHQGKIAEMMTGEGKTLVATLPTYLNALAGRGVHIVTVNDYLAKRDAEWMTPLFEFHGLTIDCIDKYRPNSEERRAAYLADITYGTNNEFGFDYLRDNMAHHPSELVQRKHHYAMVDEVDSVLVDEARTPLIISGPVPRGDEHEFDGLKPRVSQVYEVQRKLTNGFMNDAKKLIAEGNDKEGGVALFRAFRGLPKHKPLIKYLSEPGIRQKLQKTEAIYLAENQRLMPEADEPLLFTIDEKNNSVELTDKGIDYLTKGTEDENFFIMPDISILLDQIEKDEFISLETKAEKKSELMEEYSNKAQRIHSVNQLLKAYALFEKEVDYLVVDNQVKIVDEQTGRTMDGRRYSDGLHQALEAKENVTIEDATQTYATVTLQNFFRMYHKLGGMTGTAETEAGELWEIYKLDVVVIPTNRPLLRDDRQDLIYKTVKEKFNAVIEETIKIRDAGRPILIGTTSVEASEVFSRMLKMRGIQHQVLNAKQHAREADVIAEAGKAGIVTIATNMAGRGTDIKLTDESKAAGGLAIIGTERHESRRVDRQLRGRAGRQGDVGSSQFFVSLEDSLMRLFGSERIAKMMDSMGFKEGEVIQHSMVTKSIERAQKKVEENNFGTRKRLLEYDDVMNAQREVIYKRRRNALYGERLGFDVQNAFYDLCEEFIASYKMDKNFEQFQIDVVGTFGFVPLLPKEQLDSVKDHVLSESFYQEVIANYEEKGDELKSKLLPVFKQLHAEKGNSVSDVGFVLVEGGRQLRINAPLKEVVESGGDNIVAEIQKGSVLGLIDHEWKEHLRGMDDLKQSVRNASYEQKDPLMKYKFEGFNMFKALLSTMNSEVASFLFKAELPARTEAAPAPIQQRAKVKESKANASGGSEEQEEEEKPKLVPIKAQKLPGRNDRVSVRYFDGEVKADVKFKNVEQDVAANRCVLVED